VYQDGQSGVIGLPENTSHWPTYYRKHAEELMSKHFPAGYEIIRAEEVEEGSRTLTINGTNAAEIDTGNAGKILSLGKLGRTSSRTQADSVKIKECRIVYKKTGSEPTVKHGEYADQAIWNPTAYIDPNSTARNGSGTSKTAEANKKKDSAEHSELAKEPKGPKPDESKKSIPVKAASALDLGLWHPATFTIENLCA